MHWFCKCKSKDINNITGSIPKYIIFAANESIRLKICYSINETGILS